MRVANQPVRVVSPWGTRSVTSDDEGIVDGVEVRIHYNPKVPDVTESHGALASLPKGLLPPGFELYDKPGVIEWTFQTVMPVAFFFLGYHRSTPLPGSDGRRHVDATSKKRLRQFLTRERIAALNAVESDIEAGAFGGQSSVSVHRGGAPPDVATMVEMGCQVVRDAILLRQLEA